MNKLDEDLEAKKVIHRLFMKCCAERDISAQEVCHSLLCLKLHCAGGRNFVSINTSDKKWVQLESEDISEDGTSKRGRSLFEKYMERPDRLSDESLWKCAKKYNVDAWTPVQKPRVFPGLKKGNTRSQMKHITNNKSYCMFPGEMKQT